MVKKDKKKIFHKSILLLFIILLNACLCTAETSAGDFGYGDYAYILSKYVDIDGMVSYSALKADRGKLDAFALRLATLNESVFSLWQDNEKIAFWINAYNALTLKVIIDNYPIKAGFFASFLYPLNSIRQIPGVWDKMRFSVMGKMMTLEEIEHQRLRANFDEPRIHFALVCASMGCPPLRGEPYSPEKLDTQLDSQVENFLANGKKFRIDEGEEAIYLSPIFKWFAEDFEKGFGGNRILEKYGKNGAVINFITRYIDDNRALLLKNRRYEIEYLHYDWSLNEQK